MNKYKVLNVLGDGSFGTVMMAENSLNGENVAIKKIKKKFYTWDECLQLREVKSLQRISHTNIIKLKEVLRENDELFFIFEYMGGNLYDVEPVDFIIGDAGY
jgi:serine/threonine protein kinase